MTSGYRAQAGQLLCLRFDMESSSRPSIGLTIWAEHFQRLQRRLASGQLILVGPTLGAVNTGLVIFEAPDEQAARQVMEEDPVVRGGYARGEVRPFRVSLLRGRD